MSGNQALVNRHITRVLNDGGDFSRINQSWMQTAYAWLVSNSVDKDLLIFVDPAFGVKEASGHLTKVYNLGGTWLPIFGDLKQNTSNTTYNATGLNSSIPAWVNANTSAQSYFGNGRYNQIQRKNKITIAALYERTQTTSNCAFFGKSTSYTTTFAYNGLPNFDGNTGPGISLIHSSGSPGTIQFSLKDQGGLQTASKTASGAATQIAIGTYDGTTMLAYSDGVAGTGNTSLQWDPYAANDSALAGAKGQKLTVPVLCSGSDQAVVTFPNPNNPPFSVPPLSFVNNYAQFKCSSLIVLGVGLDATKVTSLYNLLKTRAGI